MALLVAAMTMPAYGVTVHTWVDQNGVRHFADVPPDGSAVSEQIDLVDAPDAVSAESDYYSISNQWARLRAERDQEAQRKLERDRLRASERASREVDVAREREYGNRWQGNRFIGYLPYGGIGRQHFGAYGDGGGPAIDRGAYLDQRRQRGFTPSATPRWPRER